MSETWIAAGDAADVTKKRKVVVEHDGHQVVVIAHEGAFYALRNICIHKQRELAKGVVLNGKIVCPGHQWAFALDTGYESVKDECQPTYAVRVNEGVVEVAIPASAETPVSDACA